MSLFGLLSILVFFVVMGVFIALYYNKSEDVPLAGFLILILFILMLSQLVIALFEYPAWLIDLIVFVSMGYKWLAQVIFLILAVIVLFALAVPLSKVRRPAWIKLFKATPAKVITLGLLIMTLFCYTELFNGVFSFNSYRDFAAVRSSYEEYDNGVWPTKYILDYDEENERQIVSLYPFDVTTASGRQDFIYKGVTYTEADENGKSTIWFYPFTWRLYEGGTPVSFADASYIPNSRLPAESTASETDTAVSDGDTE